MDLIHFLKEHTPRWLEGNGQYPEMVVSTRCRLARNLEVFPFPHMLDEKQRDEVWETVMDVVQGIPHMQEPRVFQVLELSELERAFLVERRLASVDLVRSMTRGTGGVVSSDETVSLMINEEDHLRLQVILPGFQLDEAWATLSELDRDMGSKVEYAYSGDFGFLTTHPSNLGLALRCSVLLHLPGIVLSRKLEAFARLLADRQLLLRGFYGEWSRALGNMFQVSSRRTLGVTEEDMLDEFRLAVIQILNMEKEAREELQKEHKTALEDKIYRSLAILKSARMITFQEASLHLSFLRLGVGLGLLLDLPVQVLNEMLMFGQPAHLQILYDHSMDSEERDVLRARYFRTKLTSLHLT